MLELHSMKITSLSDREKIGKKAGN